jgi:hypothetical protein
MHRVHRFVVAALSLFLISAVECAAQGSGVRELTYNGQWWSAVQPAERESFVAGYLDCYRYDLKGAAKYEAKSIVAYRDRVSQYFADDRRRAGQSVAFALTTVADRPGEKGPSGGEVWHDRHGYFDGTYWRQAFATGGVEAQRGFVEGYLACDEQVRHGRQARSRTTASDYVTRINRWYRFDPESGDVETSREKAKIADVLAKVRLP